MGELKSYAPHWLLGRLYERFFEHVTVDEAWAARVREADARGTVLYVLRNLSFVDFFALDFLTRKLGLPQVRFANDLGLWVLDPGSRGLLDSLRPRTEDDKARELRRVIDAGASAALFLKRPPSLLEPAPVVPLRDGRGAVVATRGRAEGDLYLREVLRAQRERKSPILLVPQVFVWSKHPDEARHGVVDTLFGPREWPGRVRTVAQFLLNYRHVTLRAGEPLSVAQFLAHEGDGGKTPDAVLVRRLTYALLRRLERERHAVVGPTRKPLDRLRDEVVRSPKLQKTIVDMAGEGSEGRRALGYRALAMVRELESAQDMNAVRLMDAAYDATLAKMYSAVEVDEPGLARLRERAKDGTLILLPSHKSHVDYIILTRVFYHARMPAPVIAAGDNLNFFPLGALLRRGGAFFIRRSFKGDRLYGAVVDAYMRRLIKDGVSIELFLEGGRSRTGKLLPPKLGLLSMMVEAALGSDKKVYFCPISIGYERIVEEKSYVRELTGGEKRTEDVRGLLRALETVVGRYGRLNVQFGEPLTLEGVVAELGPAREAAEPSGQALTPARRRATVTRLGHRVMNEINRITAVTPGALVALALLSHGRRGIADPDLLALCARLVQLLTRAGARFTPSLLDAHGAMRREAVHEALELFLRAGHVTAHCPGEPVDSSRRAPPVRPGNDAFYVVRDEGRHSLDLAKNIVVHFFVPRGLIATSLFAQSGPPCPRDAMRARLHTLSRLFRFEFSFLADAGFDRSCELALSAMVDDGELLMTGEDVALAEGGPQDVRLYARIFVNFVEGYRVAARSLSALLKGPLSTRELGKRAVTAGERMFLTGEIERREAVSRSLFENAYSAFVDQGYLARSEGKLLLAESFASAEALPAIEGKIAGFLPRSRRP